MIYSHMSYVYAPQTHTMIPTGTPHPGNATIAVEPDFSAQLGEWCRIERAHAQLGRTWALFAAAVSE